MSKKKSVSISIDNSPEQQALSQLNSGHFKEAIGLYKKLWHETDDEKWQQKLAFCYLQRSLSFADRGMIKEALVLWDNYSQHARPPLEAYDQYIVWLLQTNNKPKIKTSLQQLSAVQLDKQYPELASLLGFLILTETPELQKYLPQDSAFITHFNYVQIALNSYQDDDPEKVAEALKKLPYRSAFRDFRSLLSAYLFAQNSMELQVHIDKIPANSPYSSAARLLFTQSLQGAELATALAQFTHKQRRFISSIKGFNKKQQDFIEKLSRQHDRLTDKVKFNLAIQFKSLCGSEFAQLFCQSTLATYPAGHRDFKKNFSEPNAFEKNRVKALQLEQKGNVYDAEYYWQQCIKMLIKEDADNGLKIALIIRRLAAQLPENDERIDMLAESLRHDPDDRECCLNILSYYGRYADNVNDYKQWLKKTLEKFPQDIEVLTLAINTAIANKAYKKACQYAKKILTFDPLNTFAKQILFSSHLAHARKLVKEKKYHLLNNEIKQAEKLKIGKTQALQTQLMQGITCFVSQDKAEGLELIAESLKQLHSDPLNMYLQASMEALLTGLPVATVLRVLPSTKNILLSVQELTELIKQLKLYAADNEQQNYIHKSLDKIKPVLKQSLSKQSYDEPLLLELCKTFDDLNHFELLRHCSKIGWDKWMTPLWVYYKIYSDASGMPERLNQRHIYSLQHNREKAFESKDERAMVLIDSLLDAYFQIHPQQGLGFLDDLFGFDEEDNEEDDEEFYDDPLGRLFDHLPEHILGKIDKHLAKLMKKTSPERLVKELAKSIDMNQFALFSAMMTDADLFSALMVVKTAQSLKIELDVGFDDVLKAFNVNHNNDSFPF